MEKRNETADPAMKPGEVSMIMPTDIEALAEWWCAVNGNMPPPGHADLSEAECSALYDQLTMMPGVEQAGLALWRGRLDSDLYPQDGRPRMNQRITKIGTRPRR